MYAITTLVQAPRRASRRAYAVALVVAVTIAVTPLMRWAPARAADDQPATRATDVVARPAEDEPFVARFSNGVEVEFVGLSMNPSRGQPWWRPDGWPLDETPYSKMRVNLAGARLAREICFRWRRLPDGPDHTLNWSTAPHYNAAGEGQPADDDGQRIAGMEAAAFAFDADLATCTVRFSASVAATPWKTVFRSDGRHHESSGSVAGGRPRSVAWAPAVANPGGLPGLSITVTHSAPGEEARLIAIDQSGAEHLASRSPGTGASNYFMRTYYFDHLKPGDVERFELQTQTREIETAEFANVSLQPNQLTKVTAQVIKEQKPQP
jgi:hypothetical protein